MTLVALGPPRTKKNSLRILRGKGGRSFVAQSRAACSWEEAAALQFAAQWRRPALAVPVAMSAIVYRERADGDLLNYLAAVSDALERAGVVVNDRLIVSVDGSRLAKDAARPRVEVTITESPATSPPAAP